MYCIQLTAQLNFRLVSDNTEFGVDELISETGENLKISKRIVMSGENLVDAQPSIQNQQKWQNGSHISLQERNVTMRIDEIERLFRNTQTMRGKHYMNLGLSI